MDVPQFQSIWEFVSVVAVLGLQAWNVRETKKTAAAVDQYTTITGDKAVDARFGAAYDAGYIAGRRSCGATDVPTIPATIPTHAPKAPDA